MLSVSRLLAMMALYVAGRYALRVRSWFVEGGMAVTSACGWLYWTSGGREWAIGWIVERVVATDRADGAGDEKVLSALRGSVAVMLVPARDVPP